MTRDPGSIPGYLAAVARWLGGPEFVDVDDLSVPPGDHPDPGTWPSLAAAYEAALTPGDRHAAGAFYTPVDVAERLVAVTVVDGPVLDPACGGGAFLLAAARHLADRGGDPADIVGRHVFGADTDPWAVAVCRWELARWAGVAPADVPGVVVADPLAATPDVWPDRFGAVVGNPPFLSPLRTSTSRSPERRRLLKARFGDAVRAYTDDAWLFLADGIDRLADGGRLALIQPVSLLGARDAGPVRDRIGGALSLDGLWLDRSGIFDGHTQVCAPIVVRDRTTGLVHRFVDRAVASATSCSLPADEASWGDLVADLIGLPVAEPVAAGRVDDRAAVTAGFRQHFYGLAPGVGEAVDGRPLHPLVTTGLVDPLDCRWGRTPARFAGRRWERPVVDVAAVTAADAAVGEWLAARQRPKLLVATQTAVVEVIVDGSGDLVPCTPLIVVEPESDADLWRLAAALTAPVISAVAARRTGGAARSMGRIKLSARQVAALPIPVDDDAWSAGADLARAIAAAPPGTADRWTELGRTMNRAYGIHDDGLVAWWWARHPAGIVSRNR